MAEFVKVASLDNVPEGKMIEANFAGKEVMLANVGGSVYAINDKCCHKGGPLHEGTLEDHNVVCLWHRARYDIATGKVAKETPWGVDAKTYEVKIEGNDILVRG
jgi:nitrite reductase/ring-hydroxylating ferredoxin subunit